MFRVYRFLLAVICLVTGACTGWQGYHDRAVSMAEGHGFIREKVDTGKFTLLTFHKGLDNRENLLVVYIEGDGHAWRRKHVLSSNPTPKNPLGLKLAVRDRQPSVLYITRPCQYVDLGSEQNCTPKYWSSHRYADEIITSINKVINWGMKRAKADSLILIGYSGGGTVATLIAARRNDVKWLVTVAANLDHRLWTEMHRVQPLSGSLNAADITQKIEHIPQLHFVGAKDDVVPLQVVESYKNNTVNPARMKIAVIPDFDHECCWMESWPELLCRFNQMKDTACQQGE